MQSALSSRFLPLVCSALLIVFLFTQKMVENVIHFTSDYEEPLRRCQNVPRLSYGRRMLMEDGASNRFFLMYLFCNESMAIKYLKDIGLLRSKMQCNTCGRDMARSADSSKVDGYRWWCRKRVAGVVCNQFASIRSGSCRVNSPSKKFYLLLMTPCAANKPPGSETNIA